MNDSAVSPTTDTSDMVRVHRVFREAFAAAAPLVGSVAPGDADRVDVVASFYANVIEFLAVHHAGEDELVWPRLLERVTPEEAETVRRVAGQHLGVHESLQAAREQLAGWRSDPTVDSGAHLAAALATLGAQLALHLDEEERVILPIAAQHLTPAEWGELPVHGMQHFGGDKIWLVIGLIQEQMSPAEAEQMTAQMPPPVQEFWTNVGRPQFDAFVAELRG